MPPIIVRTLKHEFKLHAPTERVREALQFIEISPELPDFNLEIVDIHIAEKDGFCVACLPDGSLIESSPGHLVNVLHRLILADVVRSEPEAVLVHGATVLMDGSRVALVGHKGCGKTTLTLHLLGQGYRVEGDEHLLVRPKDVVARPRTLRVKPGTLTLVPEIADTSRDAPFTVNWDGTPIRAVIPATGFEKWTIRAGRLDAIIFLMANRGGRSVIGRLSLDEAFRRLIDEVVVWPANVAAGASRLRALVSSTKVGEMLLGDLAGAEWHLKRFLTS